MKNVIIGAIVIVLVGGGIFWYTRRAGASGSKGQAQYKLAEPETGTVKKTVSATGTLQAWRMIDIKSKAGGRVDEMLVEVGDTVRAGQVLARIDPADTLLQVNQARADVASANARKKQNEEVAQLQRLQTTNSISSAEVALAAARANLNAAIARRDRAKAQADSAPVLWRASMQNSTANYENVQKQHAQLLVSFDQERATAQSSYDQAKANLENARANLSRQKSLWEKGFVSKQVVDSAQANFEVMAAQVMSSKTKLDTLAAEQEAEKQASIARVNQAKAQLDNMKAQEVDIEIAKQAHQEAIASVKQLEEAVKQAGVSLKQAKDNKANDAIRSIDVPIAAASIARSEASLVNANTTLDQTTVRAPTDGVILQKYVEQGTIISSALSFAASGNNILQLGDVTRMYIDVTVDETDIANVDVGQRVDVTMDAYAGIPFEGKVARIDPKAVVEQNVTTIHVRVEIDNSAPTYQLLKPGMNATCEFVVNEKENVLFVPTEAVRQDNEGRYVEIGTGGKPAPPDPKTGEPAEEGMLVDVKIEQRRVEIGLEGNDSIEIVSGLKGGEKVVVQTVEPPPDQPGGAFGSTMGRMGGFQRR